MRALILALTLATAVPAPLAWAAAQTQATVADTLAIQAVDPTPETNPPGAPYPGARGGDQLVLYTKGERTGTNEYGFEVTVVDGRVMRREGANSAIPTGGYVVSGHGKAAAWIREKLPLGTLVTWTPTIMMVTAAQDPAAAVWRAKLAYEQLMTVSNQTDPALQRRLATLETDLLNQTASAEATAKALEDDIRQATWRAYPTLPAGARGTWFRPEEKDAAGVDKTVARAKSLGVDVLYLETLFQGYTIYPSQVYARWGITPQNPRYAGWDPLQAYIDAGRKHGVRIVPWVHTIYTGYETLKPPSPILARYPEWANRQRATADVSQPLASTVEGGSYFLDPAHPQVVQFLSEVVAELAAKYDVPAIQLDDTRYPLEFPDEHPAHLASTWGYTPVARQAFQARFAVDPLDLRPDDPQWGTWTDWRMNRLTDLVAALHRSIKKADPTTEVQVDFATGPMESKHKALQDWTTWIDQGLVDALGVLNYTSSLDTIRQNVRMVDWASLGKVKLVVGVFGPFLQATTDETLAQMLTAYRAGASVVSLFSLQKLGEPYQQALPASMLRAPASTPKGR